MTVMGTPSTDRWYPGSSPYGSFSIAIDDERSNPKKGQGFRNVVLRISVYDSSQKAIDVCNENITRDEQTRHINNFPYPAVIRGPIYGI